MNKRGAEDMLLVIGLIVAFVAAYLALAFWIGQSASGAAATDQSISKQIALVIDAADPGTELLIEKEVNISNGYVVVGRSSYPSFNNAEITASKFDGGTKLVIANG